MDPVGLREEVTSLLECQSWMGSERMLGAGRRTAGDGEGMVEEGACRHLRGLDDLRLRARAAGVVVYSRREMHIDLSPASSDEANASQSDVYRTRKGDFLWDERKRGRG